MSKLYEVLALINEAKVHLQRAKAVGGAVAKEAGRVLTLLEEIPALDGVFSSSHHPVAKHLGAAFAGASTATAGFVNAIRSVAEYLPWTFGYETQRDAAPGLENAMGWAEIIGPEAPFRSGRVCLGLTLIGPETLYPAHAHPATELYYVIAGTAEWTAAGITHTNPPGSFILHPSQVVHSMKTSAEPLLALYTWSGEDVKTTSYFTSPKHE